MRRLALALSSCCALLLLALPVHAQQYLGADPITVDISPEYPAPYDVVTVSPGSTLLDLSASSVTVALNGKVVSTGSGTASTQVQMGGPGEKTTITVTAASGGQRYSKDIVIRPAEVALVVEPQSATHPFYAGSGLVGSEGGLRLVAMPDLRTAPGTRVPAANLVYTWKLGNQILQDSSGIGRSVLNATAPPRYRDALITLTVTTQDSALVAQATTDINPVDPMVRIYQTDPLIGPWFNVALTGTFSMPDTEASFRAVPYYFGGNPVLTWSVNNAPSGGDKDITVRSSGNGAGVAALAIDVATSALHQIADSQLRVQFGANKPLGIFGL